MRRQTENKSSQEPYDFFLSTLRTKKQNKLIGYTTRRCPNFASPSQGRRKNDLCTWYCVHTDLTHQRLSCIHVGIQYRRVSLYRKISRVRLRWEYLTFQNFGTKAVHYTSTLLFRGNDVDSYPLLVELVDLDPAFREELEERAAFGVVHKAKRQQAQDNHALDVVDVQVPLRVEGVVGVRFRLCRTCNRIVFAAGRRETKCNESEKKQYS